MRTNRWRLSLRHSRTPTSTAWNWLWTANRWTAGKSPGGWMLIMSALPPTRCSSTWLRQALPEGWTTRRFTPPGAIRRMTSPTWRPSCNQAMTSIISLPSTVAYAISTLKTRLMISSATRSNGRLPPGRLHPPTPFLAAQSITTTSCSTPVCWCTSPNASRHGSTSPRAWSCRTRVNTMVAASMVLQWTAIFL